MPTIAEILARELDKPLAHVQNVIDLLDQGNTIPFIARYRKELHGSMDDTALRTLEDRLSYLRNLNQRRQEVKNAIDGQGKLTDELSAAIDTAATLAEVETCTAPINRSAAPGPRWPGRRAWSPWPFCCWTRAGTARLRRRLPGTMWTRRRGWRLWLTPSRGPTTS